MFAKNGSRCAYPGCELYLIKDGTEKSKDKIIGKTAHIHANNEGGSRWKEGLTPEERNSLDNLILLCPNHHDTVDGQPEEYPVELLRKWKKDNENKVKVIEASLPKVFDPVIEDGISVLRKSQFFEDFDSAYAVQEFGKQLLETELASGSLGVRSRALAWCVRLLLSVDEVDKAKEYISAAKYLSDCQEVKIAEAFLVSKEGDKDSALRILGDINSPSLRSAAFMVIVQHDGAEKAFDWLEKVGITADLLDSDGKYFLLVNLLNLHRWDKVKEVLGALNSEDFEETPILHYVTGIAYLVFVVPDDLRPEILAYPPLEARFFPLASDEASMNIRREAQRHFSDAEKIARQFDYLDAAALADEYAIWLGLRDEEYSTEGKRRLEEKLRDLNSNFHLVPLGLQFGINLQTEEVEQEIKQRISRRGEVTRETASARFTLAFNQGSPEEVADYIEQHYDELSEYLVGKSVKALQVKMLLRARLFDRADNLLNSLSREEFSDSEINDLRKIIEDEKSPDSVEAQKMRFKESDALEDLLPLIANLLEQGGWNDLCEYSEILFKKTGDFLHAEQFAEALYKTHKTKRLTEFIESHLDFLEKSKQLQFFYCWALYCEGRLVEARQKLERLDDELEDLNHRRLYVGIRIASGDWSGLSGFVVREHDKREVRNAADLMFAAELAVYVRSPKVKELILAAVSKGGDDPKILTAAYFWALSIGWESAETSRWILKASELSGEDGPIKQMPIREILDRQPKWNQKVSEISQSIYRNEMPLFLAASHLNRSLIDLTLSTALSNLSENDPRRRRTIPSYSGNYKSTPTDIDVEQPIGLDATALLTLSFLGILDKVFDTFDKVYIPHSTMAWLIEEKQRAMFHQPSRIRDAHKMRDLLSREILKRFIPSTTADNFLLVQLGDELAPFITEAENSGKKGDVQHIVVSPSPIHESDLSMGRETSTREHAAVISGCLPVVEKLRDKGHLTSEEMENAGNYLQAHEKPRPNQPEITDEAVLYLDSVSITYFLHLGILEKLHNAGFTLVVSPREISEANELIAYEGISSKVIKVIERIRSSVRSHIETRKITVGRQQAINKRTGQPVVENPTVDALTLINDCDVIISDDRFINQIEYGQLDNAQSRILSTLNLLDTLALSGSISPQKRLEYKTQLRRAGYAFIPVDEDELAQQIRQSSVIPANEDELARQIRQSSVTPVNGDELAQQIKQSAIREGTLSETAELKAIRENILQIRMSDFLQIPQEVFWLNSIYDVFTRVLKNLWVERGDSADDTTVRSDWILNCIDIRGWAHRFGSENGDNLVKIWRGEYILMLTMPPLGASQEARDSYWKWLGERVLKPVRNLAPDLYNRIVEVQKAQISEISKQGLPRRK